MAYDLKEVIGFISSQDDRCAEVCVDAAMAKFPFIVDYDLVEEDDWTQDCKYQLCNETYKLSLDDGTSRYIDIGMSRSGSPFTDWYYSVDSVTEVERFEGNTKITVTVSGENQEAVAEYFLSAIQEVDSANTNVSINTQKEEGWK